MERSAKLSNLVFRAPSLLLTFASLVVGSVILGLFLSPSPTGVVRGLLLLAVPGFAAGLLSAPLANALGGTLYYKRAAFLALVGAAIAGVATVVSAPLSALLDVPAKWVLVVGYMMVAAFRHAVLFAISDNRNLWSLPVSGLQTAVALPILWAIYGFTPRDWLVVGLLAVVFLAPLVFFLRIFDTPLEENFDASASEMFRAYLDHLTTGSFDAEEVLNRWSEPIDAQYGVVGFHRPDGSNKATMVVPVLHPGPVGRLGGGDLPGKVSEIVGASSEFVMVPHGPATHDYNPTTTQEVERFARSVRDLVEDLEPEPGGSPAVTAGDHVRVTSQVFGEGVLLTYTSWPQALDDVEHGVGLAAELRARIAGASHAVFADCHNSLRPGAGQVYLSTPRAEAILDHAEEATREAFEQRVGSLQAGVAQDDASFDHRHGIGAQGVQALVVEAGGTRHAYVLWDGNNMLPEVTERLAQTVEHLVDSVQVMTTDNHSINAVAGAFGPVGQGVDVGRLEEVMRSTVEAAIDDLEPVESSVSRGMVPGLRVYGHHKTAMLTASMNTMTSIFMELVAATVTMQALGTTILFLLL